RVALVGAHLREGGLELVGRDAELRGERAQVGAVARAAEAAPVTGAVGATGAAGRAQALQRALDLGLVDAERLGDRRRGAAGLADVVGAELVERRADVGGLQAELVRECLGEAVTPVCARGRAAGTA